MFQHILSKLLKMICSWNQNIVESMTFKCLVFSIMFDWSKTLMWCWWWSWFRNCIYLSQKLIETITSWSTKTSSHRCHRIQLRVWQYKFCKVILDGAPKKRWKHIRSKVAPGWRHCHHFTAAQSWVAHNTESPLFAFYFLCALYVLHLCIQLLYICLIR